MNHNDLTLIALFERVLACVKPGSEDDPEIVNARECLADLRKHLNHDMREHLRILEDCIADDVTPPPWCAFGDGEDGILAIMKAGREGDVFKFEEAPREEDAHYLLLTQPHYIQAIIHRIRTLETQYDVSPRWTLRQRRSGPHRNIALIKPILSLKLGQPWPVGTKGIAVEKLGEKDGKSAWIIEVRERDESLVGDHFFETLEAWDDEFEFVSEEQGDEQGSQESDSQADSG